MSRLELSRDDSGFSLIELTVVVSILLIVSAFAVPNLVSMIHSSKLRGSASDLDSVVQLDRIRAVQDGKFYSLYISATGTGGAMVFVDLNGTQAYATAPKADPLIFLSGEVRAIQAGNAPNTADLYGRFLPAGSAIPVYDGTDTAGGNAITFSARGLPCKRQTASDTVGAVITTGQVCDSAGGAIPYWIFLQNTTTGNCMAITVNPAGRIRKWYYGGGAWNAS